MNSSNETMTMCPKFESCSAPMCPLDPDWRLRVYRKGEPICFYLLEYVKPDTRAQFQGSIEGQIYKAIQTSIDPMSTRYATLLAALERAKRTGSRMPGGAPQKAKSPSSSNRDDDSAPLER
jgi:hypothetical protein